MTTDITELAQSLKAAAEKAEDNSDPNMFVQTIDILALVEALEKAQQDHRLHAARLISEKALLKERIAELEESNAQVIQSRDHYKRMTEEGLKQLAESRTVTVKLPKKFKTSMYGTSLYEDLDILKMLNAAGIKVEGE